jgi:hypothetical protein
MNEIDLREALIEDDPFLAQYTTFKKWQEEYYRLYLSQKGTVPSITAEFLFEWYAEKIEPEEVINIMSIYGEQVVPHEVVD